MATRVVSLAEATVDFDCKTPMCEGRAKSSCGHYAYYCAACISKRQAERQAAPPSISSMHASRAAQTPLAPPARDLARAAAAVDLARQRHAKHGARLDVQVRKLREAHAKQGEALKGAVVQSERDYLRIAASMGLGPIGEQP